MKFFMILLALIVPTSCFADLDFVQLDSKWAEAATLEAKVLDAQGVKQTALPEIVSFHPLIGFGRLTTVNDFVDVLSIPPPPPQVWGDATAEVPMCSAEIRATGMGQNGSTKKTSAYIQAGTTNTVKADAEDADEGVCAVATSAAASFVERLYGIEDDDAGIVNLAFGDITLTVYPWNNGDPTTGYVDNFAARVRGDFGDNYAKAEWDPSHGDYGGYKITKSIRNATGAWEGGQNSVTWVKAKEKIQPLNVTFNAHAIIPASNGDILTKAYVGGENDPRSDESYQQEHRVTATACGPGTTGAKQKVFDTKSASVKVLLKKILPMF